eukprot:TRINITY_DN4010_c0_g1_i2.p1 TRINITY_DN4010_c0_g1~~TRINITY_DN4010_c0_g1_i2.p1  ORF type:complete len:376 (+),score=59.98 TRINITY_DN4010_c0_g1_i2:29-1129(+)
MSAIHEYPEHTGPLKLEGKKGSIVLVKLSNHILYFYSTVKSKKPMRIIQLDSADECIAGHGNRITISFRGEKNLNLQCRNSDQQSEWMNAISQSIDVHDEYTDSELRNIRVYFPDMYFLNCVIRQDTNAEELWWLVSEAGCLGLESRRCFFLYAVSTDLELMLKADDVVMDIFDSWSTIQENYIGFDQGPLKIFLRPIPNISLSVERKISDNTSVHIFFTQGMHNVKKGNYIVNMEECVELAALRCQIQNGDFNPMDHQRGYISNSLAGYVPPYLIEKKKPEVWERLISQAHQALAGKDALICRLLYLQQLRQRPYYNSHFFRTKNESTGQNSCTSNLSKLTFSILCPYYPGIPSTGSKYKRYSLN